MPQAEIGSKSVRAFVSAKVCSELWNEHNQVGPSIRYRRRHSYHLRRQGHILASIYTPCLSLRVPPSYCAKSRFKTPSSRQRQGELSPNRHLLPSRQTHFHDPTSPREPPNQNPYEHGKRRTATSSCDPSATSDPTHRKTVLVLTQHHISAVLNLQESKRGFKNCLGNMAGWPWAYTSP